MHKIKFIALAVVVSLSLGLTVVTKSHAGDPQSASPISTSSPEPGDVNPNGPPLPITGGQAIRNIPGVGATITEADVDKYLMSYGLPKTLPGSSITTASATLLTSKKISDLLNGESTGLPDDKVLWFATMDGVFIFPAPKDSPTYAAHRGYAVFDPDTGNIYMWGSLS